MAVDPSAQGRGCSRAALDIVSWAADRDGVPCFLETHGPRNVCVYERLGYENRGTRSTEAENLPLSQYLEAALKLEGFNFFSIAFLPKYVKAR